MPDTMIHSNLPISEEVVISDEELRSLTTAILKRHGIDFTCYEPKSLKRRINHALHHFKMTSIHELWVRLLREHGFIYPLMDELSVGLTSMFRDPILWTKLKSILSSDYKQKELTIWHAGCSTGEEVFSMGIVIRESGYTGKAKAFATDFSGQSIEASKAGVYHKLKIEEYNHNYTQYNPAGSLWNYGKTIGEQLHMDLSLSKHVSYAYQNLITDPAPGKFDIIFCRNVMIYFDSGAKKLLFKKFYEALNPGGFFIIGFYDASLPIVDYNYFKSWDAEARIFQRID